MTTQESTHLNTQSELLKALAEHAISFPSDEEANAAGFYMNDASLGSCGEGLHGVVIYYHDLQGNRLPFHRMRFANPPVNSKTGKATKYKQPKGVPPQAYFPNCVNWLRVSQDVSTPIIIIEGEYKAHSTSLNLNIPAIGLGGVNSYKSKEQAADPDGLLPDLDEVQWEGRKVTICFDSDSVGNENVAKAQERLLKVLTQKRAEPYFVTLPSAADGGKQGLDDFIVNSGVDLVRDFLANNAVPHLVQKRLCDFRKRVAYIRETGDWVDKVNNCIIRRTSAPTLWADEQVVVRNASGKPIKLPLLRAYAEWKGKHIVHNVDCVPGKPQFFFKSDAKEYFNTWQNTRPALVEGDVQTYLDYVEVLFGNTPELVPYWHNWVATIIQKDAKMPTAWLLYSQTQGTGKSTLPTLIGYMFGESSFNHVKQANMQREVANAVNAEGVQLVLMDDLDSHGSRKDAGDLKTLITSEWVNVNIKFKADYKARDYRNYVFTSNRADALYLEPSDRRYFYVHTRETVMSEAEYQALFYYRSPEGAGKLRNFYVNYAISEGFTEGTRPPESATRATAIVSSMSNVQSFINDLKTGALSFDGVTLFTSTDLAMLAVLERVVKDADPRRFGRSLVEAGINPCHGSQINYGTGATRRKISLYSFDGIARTNDAARQAYEDETVARTNLLAGVQGNMKF